MWPSVVHSSFLAEPCSHAKIRVLHSLPNPQPGPASGGRSRQWIAQGKLPDPQGLCNPGQVMSFTGPPFPRLWRDLRLNTPEYYSLRAGPLLQLSSGRTQLTRSAFSSVSQQSPRGSSNSFGGGGVSRKAARASL